MLHKQSKKNQRPQKQSLPLPFLWFAFRSDTSVSSSSFHFFCPSGQVTLDDLNVSFMDFTFESHKSLRSLRKCQLSFCQQCSIFWFCVTFLRVASFWNQHQPTGHFLCSAPSLSSLLSAKCVQIECVKWFRPPRCYRWLFSGLFWTAWSFFCCSSPRAR